MANLGRSAYLAVIMIDKSVDIIDEETLQEFYFVLALFCVILPTFIVLILHHKAFYRRKLD